MYSIKAKKAAFVWCLLTVLFGLIQLWWSIGISVIDRNITYDFEGLINSCALIFFSTALVASLAIDFFYYANQKNYTLKQIGIVFVLFPFFILLITLMMFTVCDIGSAKFEFLVPIQLVILTMSLIYAFQLKCRELKN